MCKFFKIYKTKSILTWPFYFHKVRFKIKPEVYMNTIYVGSTGTPELNGTSRLNETNGLYGTPIGCVICFKGHVG